MPSLTDRLILITGASRGLGAALAEACAAEGARLILLARTRGALEEVDDLRMPERANLDAVRCPLAGARGRAGAGQLCAIP